MVKQGVVSREAAAAVREAERIIRGREWGSPEVWPQKPSRTLRRRLLEGVMAVAFLAFCFLPALTVLALVALGIYLAR